MPSTLAAVRCQVPWLLVATGFLLGLLQGEIPWHARHFVLAGARFGPKLIYSRWQNPGRCRSITSAKSALSQLDLRFSHVDLRFSFVYL